jgi:hypothetical protein
MSTIRAKLVQDDVGTYTAAPLYPGISKAWSSLDGTGTIAANDDFNIASYTDNGTGEYTPNIANDMSSLDYCVTTASDNGTTDVGVVGYNKLAGSYDIGSSTHSGTVVDRADVNSMNMGYLA